jgi:hypothetical protein
MTFQPSNNLLYLQIPDKESGLKDFQGIIFGRENYYHFSRRTYKAKKRHLKINQLFEEHVKMLEIFIFLYYIKFQKFSKNNLLSFLFM